MSLSAGHTKLRDAMRELNAKLQRVRTDWDDDARRRFEAEFLDALPGKVDSAMNGVARLAEIFSTLRRECER